MSKGKQNRITAIQLTEIAKITLGAEDTLVFIFPEEDHHLLVRAKSLVEKSCPHLVGRSLFITNRVKLAVIAKERVEGVLDGPTVT